MQPLRPEGAFTPDRFMRVAERDDDDGRDSDTKYKDVRNSRSARLVVDFTRLGDEEDSEGGGGGTGAFATRTPPKTPKDAVRSIILQVAEENTAAVKAVKENKGGGRAAQVQMMRQKSRKMGSRRGYGAGGSGATVEKSEGGEAAAALTSLPDASFILSVPPGGYSSGHDGADDGGYYGTYGGDSIPGTISPSGSDRGLFHEAREQAREYDTSAYDAEPAGAAGAVFGMPSPSLPGAYSCYEEDFSQADDFGEAADVGGHGAFGGEQGRGRHGQTHGQKQGPGYSRLEGKSYNLPGPNSFTVLDIGQKSGAGGRGGWDPTKFWSHLRPEVRKSVLVILFFALALLLTTLLTLLFSFVLMPAPPPPPIPADVEVASLQVKYWATWPNNASDIASNTTPVNLWGELQVQLRFFNQSKFTLAAENDTSVDLLFRNVSLAPPASASFFPTANATVDPWVTLNGTERVVRLVWVCDKCEVPGGQGKRMVQEQQDGKLPLMLRVRVAGQLQNIRVNATAWREGQGGASTEIPIVVAPRK